MKTEVSLSFDSENINKLSDDLVLNVTKYKSADVKFQDIIKDNQDIYQIIVRFEQLINLHLIVIVQWKLLQSKRNKDAIKQLNIE